MTVEDLMSLVTSAVFNALASFINFLPSLIGGLIVLAIGLIIAAVAHKLVLGILRAVQFERFLSKYGISRIEGKAVQWTEILGELVRWAVIIVFLVPALSIWHLEPVNSVLNRIVLYIPNVIVAVVLAIVGLAFAKIAYKVGYGASHSLGRHVAHTAGLTAQWSLTVFTAFLVLHQLGVAPELLRILFGGVVAMLALAGGLAFGLGGQSVARNLLEALWERFKR